MKNESSTKIYLFIYLMNSNELSGHQKCKIVKHRKTGRFAKDCTCSSSLRVPNSSRSQSLWSNNSDRIKLNRSWGFSRNFCGVRQILFAFGGLSMIHTEFFLQKEQNRFFRTQVLHLQGNVRSQFLDTRFGFFHL